MLGWVGVRVLFWQKKDGMRPKHINPEVLSEWEQGRTAADSVK